MKNLLKGFLIALAFGFFLSAQAQVPGQMDGAPVYQKRYNCNPTPGGTPTVCVTPWVMKDPNSPSGTPTPTMPYPVQTAVVAEATAVAAVATHQGTPEAVAQAQATVVAAQATIVANASLATQKTSYVVTSSSSGANTIVAASASLFNNLRGFTISNSTVSTAGSCMITDGAVTLWGPHTIGGGNMGINVDRSIFGQAVNRPLLFFNSGPVTNLEFSAQYSQDTTGAR